MFRQLKLESLFIENFKSLKQIEIHKLGRVNLFVGNNNSGKSSILDALKLYASFVDESVLIDLIDEHDDFFLLEEDSSVSPYESLFYGRRFKKNEKIVIGEYRLRKQLTIQAIQAVEMLNRDFFSSEKNRDFVENNRLPVSEFTYVDIKKIPAEYIRNKNLDVVNVLVIRRGEEIKQIVLDDLVERMRRRGRRTKNIIKAYSDITTSFISNNELADSWDKIVLREYSQNVLQALQIIEPRIRAVNFINSKDWNETGFYNRRLEKRIPLVSIEGLDFPVPLKSMGDGIVRLFQISLRLYEAKNGFLLIDEFDNGLHFGVQKKAWELVFNLAQELNVQIFASTHSMDCIRSFAEVALKSNFENYLFRINKKNNKYNEQETSVTAFDEEDLKILIRSNMEIR